MSIRVFLDARKLGDGGIGAYIENVVDGLLDFSAEESPVFEFTLLAPSVEDSKKCPTISSALGRWGRDVSVIYDSTPKYSLREYFAMPLRYRSELATHDLFHSPHYTLPFGIKIPRIVTVHDIIHMTHPDTALHKPISSMLIRSALSRATHVITVSEASRRKLLPYSNGRTQLTVIPNALRRSIAEIALRELKPTVKTYGLKHDYILFVGGERQHKGLHRLLKAWSIFKSASSETAAEPLQLRVVGSNFSDDIRRHASALGIADSVVFCEAISDEELKQLYRDARAVAVPSEEEGFGMVALEAMSLGLPVICTPVDSLREVCADCAWFSEDFTPESFAAALASALSDERGREAKVREGISRAAQFSLKVHARRTAAVYASVCGHFVVDPYFSRLGKTERGTAASHGG